MDVRLPPTSPKVFRPAPILAGVMGAAALLWIGVLVYLLQFKQVPAKTMLSAIFFVLFFVWSVLYYVRTLIVVDSKGVTYRGLLTTRRFSFSDIRKLDVLPGPVTVYAVRIPRTQVHFTSFFRQHRDLMQLLVERAGLAPSRSI